MTRRTSINKPIINIGCIYPIVHPIVFRFYIDSFLIRRTNHCMKLQIEE